MDIGGANRARSRRNLTPAWISGILRQGGTTSRSIRSVQLRACLGDVVITTSKAAAQGRAAADDAADQAAGPYRQGHSADLRHGGIRPWARATGRSPRLSWTPRLARARLPGRGVRSCSPSALIHASGSITERDVIYYADWDGKATTTSSYMLFGDVDESPADRPVSRRHVETYGGASINIDSDQLHVNRAEAAAASHSGYRTPSRSTPTARPSGSHGRRSAPSRTPCSSR